MKLFRSNYKTGKAGFYCEKKLNYYNIKLCVKSTSENVKLTRMFGGHIQGVRVKHIKHVIT